MSGGSLQSPALVAGHFGDGTFIHSGGTHTLSGVIRLGRDGGSTGFYHLSGAGRLISNGVVNVGSAGFGTFVQSGGNYTLSTGLTIAAGSTSRGRYSMSGGTLTGTQLIISPTFGAAGTFEQSGGVASFASIHGLGTLNASANARLTTNSIQLFGNVSLADDAKLSVRPINGFNQISRLDFEGGATPIGGTFDLADNDLTLVFADSATVQSQIRTAPTTVRGMDSASPAARLATRFRRTRRLACSTALSTPRSIPVAPLAACRFW